MRRIDENRRKTETKQTTLMNITDKPNTTSNGTRQSPLLTVPTKQTTPFTLESWYTNLQQNPLIRSQQLPAPYKRLIHNFGKNERRTLTIN